MAIKLPGFTSVADSTATAYVTLVYGEESTGKSRLGIQLPKPQAVIASDPKTIDLVKKSVTEFGFTDDDVIISQNMSRLSSVMDIQTTFRNTADMQSAKHAQETMSAYRDHVNKLKSMVLAVARHKTIRGLLLDSGTIIYDDILYANFGRTNQIEPKFRPVANREFMDLLEIMSDARTSDGRRKHLIVTARSQSIYENNEPTGRYKAEGCSKIGYYIKNAVELQELKSLSQRTMLNAAMRPRKCPSNARFALHLKQSLANPGLVRDMGSGMLFDDEISYFGLMSAVHVDEDPEEFY
jgi:hypothetical protein